MLTTSDYEAGQFHKADYFNPRLGFIRKVYGILSAQLLITALMVFFASFTDPGLNFFSSYAVGPLYWISFSIILCTMFSLICCPSWAKSAPSNYVILFLFTLAESFLVSTITTFYARSDVLIAVCLTASLVGVLTLYAWTTKTDFTIYGGVLCVLGWALIALTILSLLLLSTGSKAFTWTYALVVVASIVLFGFYLIYDTQIILGGDRIYQLEIDDYIIGALVLYVDIIVLFMKVLELMGILRGR